MNERLLRIAEVMEITGMKRSHIYHAVRHYDFPRPLKLGPRASAWVESDIHKWIKSRIELRDSVSNAIEAIVADSASE